MGVVRISRLLKEKVAWATDKWIRIISNNNVIQNSYATKELYNTAILNIKQYCMLCYIILYTTKQWWGETLANLVKRASFTNILHCQNPDPLN